MYNAVNKPITAIAAAIVLSISLYSCGESEATRNARNLLAEANDAVASGQYELATALIDSITNAYPGEVDIRREAMQLRPAATEGLTIQNLTRADSIVATIQTRYDSLSRLMTKIDNPELVEGYWVATQGRNPQPLALNNIEGRVTGDGEFYMVSSLNPSTLHHHSFSLADKSGSSAATSPVAYDGELNYRINGGEVVTYMSESCKEIGPFAANHCGQSLTVTFHGEGSKKMAFSAAQTSGLATAWEFSEVMKEFRHWSIERERLNRQLAIARDQKARLSSDTTGGK